MIMFNRLINSLFDIVEIPCSIKNYCLRNRIDSDSLHPKYVTAKTIEILHEADPNIK
jgi:hypothetical protein